MYYAQLDSNNICTALSDLSGVVDAPDMIPVDAILGADCIGKKYNNGAWEDVLHPDPKPIPLTPTEQAILETAINTDYLVCLKDMGL